MMDLEKVDLDEFLARNVMLECMLEIIEPKEDKPDYPAKQEARV